MFAQLIKKKPIIIEGNDGVWLNLDGLLEDFICFLVLLFLGQDVGI